VATRRPSSTRRRARNSVIRRGHRGAVHRHLGVDRDVSPGTWSGASATPSARTISSRATPRLAPFQGNPFSSATTAAITTVHVMLITPSAKSVAMRAQQQPTHQAPRSIPHSRGTNPPGAPRSHHEGERAAALCKAHVFERTELVNRRDRDHSGGNVVAGAAPRDGIGDAVQTSSQPLLAGRSTSSTRTASSATNTSAKDATTNRSA
jgi:hypothetical protein